MTVLSDLDRMHQRNTTHAVPIQYGLSGYSLRMDSVRQYLEEAVLSCEKRQLFVKVIAFDGQFLEVATTGEDGQPLTILQFMKKYWQDVQKMTKEDKVSSLLNSSLMVYSGCNISKAITSTPKATELPELGESDTPIVDEQYFMQQLPADILSELDEEAITVVRQACQAAVQKKAEPEDDRSDTHDTPQPQDYESALIELLASNPQFADKWKTFTLDEFSKCLNNATTINKMFTVPELKILINVVQSLKSSSKRSKAELVNIVSQIYGDGTNLNFAVRVQSPKTLKSIVIKSIKSWPIIAINVAYAQQHFLTEFNKWKKGHQFSRPCVVQTDTGMQVVIHQWYAQPSKIAGKDVQMIIDPHHIFVNNRAKCCTKGMQEMGIHPQAWWSVPCNSKQNGTCLSLEIAKELRDRQSNAFAQTTFSLNVEEQMIQNGNKAAAKWCALIRNWYQSVDEAAMSTDERLQAMMDMRKFLLSFLHVGHFPPPGQYVADMSLAQFEGILTNIDRRLQLYAMTAQGTYCQRAVSSLDSENFFGAFQVMIISHVTILIAGVLPLLPGDGMFKKYKYIEVS